MRYKKFIVKQYKAITEPTTIDISKNSLIPIVGVNECGKTTLLNAIFAFDSYNDSFNQSIRHLTDVENLYKIENKQAEISAIIEVDFENLRKIIKEIDLADELEINEEEIPSNQKPKKYKFDLRKIKFPLKEEYNGEIQITRVLSKSNIYYRIDSPILNFSGYPEGSDNILCQAVMLHLPFILYFDDFRESFPEKIEIKESNKTDWVSYVEQLFKKTNSNYSIHNLKNIEERIKKSIISEVTKKLNETLTREWSNFKLDNKDALKISIEFLKENEEIKKNIKDNLGNTKTVTETIEKYYLKFDVIEIDPNGNERYFYVRDRSKGFFWFFNFVMKLQFNPKVSGTDNNAIYLLDEPGSYLHSYAQNKLCTKLKEISDSNIVIYCTHSHHLLNPDIIPLNKIMIANKDDFGSIHLTPYHEYKTSPKSIQSAFQAVDDALMLRPLGLDLFHKKILIVEGIYDYYAYKIFLSQKEFDILPGKGADSLLSFISLMIGFGISYKVLWDNDKKGKEKYDEAIKFFGEKESNEKFYLLPKPSKILQDLFDGSDIKLLKSKLSLSNQTSFEKLIMNFYFSPERKGIIKSISENTKSKFAHLAKHLKIEE